MKALVLVLLLSSASAWADSCSARRYLFSNYSFKIVPTAQPLPNDDLVQIIDKSFDRGIIDYFQSAEVITNDAGEQLVLLSNGWDLQRLATSTAFHQTTLRTLIYLRKSGKIVDFEINPNIEQALPITECR